MSEKMREEFEIWAREVGLSTGEYQHGGYHFTSINIAYMAWQASRAALVVDLPCERLGDIYADGYNSALQDVEDALTEAGVNYN